MLWDIYYLKIKQLPTEMRINLELKYFAKLHRECHYIDILIMKILLLYCIYLYDNSNVNDNTNNKIINYIILFMKDLQLIKQKYFKKLI